MSVQTVKSTRQHLAQSEVVSVERERFQERFISTRSASSDLLSTSDAPALAPEQIVAQMVFGGTAFHSASCERMVGAEWPLLWVEGDVCPGTAISGMQSFVLDGVTPRRIAIQDRVVGSAWSDGDADYCLLAGVLPGDLSAARGLQTRNSFEQMEVALEQAEMDFSHVVRTWFYLDALLDWYDEFNLARTGFFESRGVFERLIPASTGIGARNPSGAALSCGALAIRPRNSSVRVHEVDSPLQCPATKYRSSFSRAVEVEYVDHRTLMISGTASIAPGGASLHPGDAVKQIHCTLDVVEAILKSRKMDWANTTRAVGYFHDIGDLSAFEECCRQRGMSPLPITPAHATICRADLLFEIELDAIAGV